MRQTTVVYKCSPDGKTHYLRFTTEQGVEGMLGFVFVAGDYNFGELKKWAAEEVKVLFGSLSREGNTYGPNDTPFIIHKGEKIEFHANDFTVFLIYLVE